MPLSTVEPGKCAIPYLPTKVLNGTSRRRIELTGTESREHISILARNIPPIDDGRCGRRNEFIFLAFIFLVNDFFLVSDVHDICEVSFGEAQAQKTAGKVTLKRKKTKHREIIFK
jgi:hypothetical protein